MYGNGYGMTGYAPYAPNGGAMNDVLTQYKGPYQGQMAMNQMQMPGMMPAMQQNAAVQVQNDPMVWVQGEAGAKSFLVAPNSKVVLWDTESPTIYIKSADSTGKPFPMRVLDFVERGNPAQNGTDPSKDHVCNCGKEFAGKDEFDKLKAKYEKLEGIVKSLVKEEEA